MATKNLPRANKTPKTLWNFIRRGIGTRIIVMDFCYHGNHCVAMAIKRCLETHKTILTGDVETTLTRPSERVKALVTNNIKSPVQRAWQAFVSAMCVIAPFTCNSFWSWIRITELIKIWFSLGSSSPIYSVTGWRIPITWEVFIAIQQYFTLGIGDES